MNTALILISIAIIVVSVILVIVSFSKDDGTSGKTDGIIVCLVFLVFLWMAKCLIYDFNRHTFKTKIKPEIETIVHTQDGISDTTYIYKFPCKNS